MYAVVRETSYDPESPVYETPEFQDLQQEHANLEGYQGAVVVEVEAGRFVTVTLWQTAEDMSAAREAMGPVVERTVNPLMVSPAKLIGTGPVVVNDLALGFGNWTVPSLWKHTVVGVEFAAHQAAIVIAGMMQVLIATAP